MAAEESKSTPHALKSERATFVCPDKLVVDGDGRHPTSWYSWSREQKHGTCTAHATCGALAYQHGISNITPYYLHKYVQWDNGMDPASTTYEIPINVEDAMHFALRHGVPSLCGPLKENQSVKFRTDTKKYQFQRIIDVMSEYTGTFSENLVKALDEHESPVVTSMFSTVTMDDGCRMLIKENMQMSMIMRTGMSPDLTAVTNATTTDAQELSHARRIAGNDSQDGASDSKSWAARKVDISETIIAHAMIVFGYDKRSGYFLVKNSWGDGEWAWLGLPADETFRPTVGGNVKMSFSFMDKFGQCAWVGIGGATTMAQYRK